MLTAAGPRAHILSLSCLNGSCRASAKPDSPNRAWNRRRTLPVVLAPALVRTARVSRRAIQGDAANRARRLQGADLKAELQRRRGLVSQLRASALQDDAAEAFDDLGVALLATGEKAQAVEAEAAFRQSLEICRRRALDADSLWAANNLAVALKAQGESRYGEALELYQEILQARLRNDPREEDPSTLTSMNNLGVLLKKQGKVVEAEQFYRRALARRRAVLGNLDPDTLTSINNLAVLLSTTKTQEAEELFAEALAGCRAVLGATDMDTLLSADNLAALLYQKGRPSEAEPLFREAALGFATLLGSRDPETLRSQDNLAVTLLELGRLDEAEVLLRSTVEGFIAIRGADHPDTAVAQENLRAVLEAKEARNREGMSTV
ncbi:KLC2 [Symbiodinium natans]|uniref:KLC2 protein n=1 Tax=Symbiodinium natans TaxID=878477 RepID=A0A812HMQ1_9DINO|nr:KLC2 [Symbiodinium natans]